MPLKWVPVVLHHLKLNIFGFQTVHKKNKTSDMDTSPWNLANCERHVQIDILTLVLWAKWTTIFGWNPSSHVAMVIQATWLCPSLLNGERGCKYLTEQLPVIYWLLVCKLSTMFSSDPLLFDCVFFWLWGCCKNTVSLKTSERSLISLLLWASQFI